MDISRRDLTFAGGMQKVYHCQSQSELDIYEELILITSQSDILSSSIPLIMFDRDALSNNSEEESWT